MGRLKKVITSSLLFLSTLLLTTQARAIQILYGPPMQDLYGPPPITSRESFFQKFLPIMLIIFVPVILIIGIVVFIKKHKSKKNDKKK